MSKDFMEILDCLATEQKQPFIDHFVQTILGKPTLPLIQTKSLTISNESSLEEKIQLTALIYNVDPASIDMEEFVLGEKEIADSKFHIKELIKEHLGVKGNTAQRTKDDELISLGKFLYTTERTFKIKPSEEPDFVLTAGDESIGVEHTRLEGETDKAFIAELWKKYLKGALILLLAEMPGLTGVANITLDTDLPVYEGKSLRNFKSQAIKNNVNEIHKTLANYLISNISGNEVARPSLIKFFNYQQSNEDFTLKYNQEFFVRTDFEKMVLSAIQKKEKRLITYKEKQPMNKWWLLLVFGGAGLSSSFKITEDILNAPIESSFDQVFILNSFNLECYELQNRQPYLRYIAKKQFRPLLLKRSSKSK